MKTLRATRPRTIPIAALLAAAVLAALPTPALAQCDVTASVVAMDQVLTYNRIGAFNPAGMIFALARDVFPKGTPLEDQTLANSCAYKGCMPGAVQLRDSKRPCPLVLRVNEGQTICINFKNLLDPMDIVDAGNEAAGIGLCETAEDPNCRESEQPVTRSASLHVHGLVPADGSVANDGSNVGYNGSSLVAPNGSTTYQLIANKEGAYVITSGPNLGGEGGSGAIANCHFGAVNVEPAASHWYRSQVTREEMVMAADANLNGVLDANEQTPDGQPILNYNALYPAGHPYAGEPVLDILDGNEIVHSDLNAIITGPMPNDPGQYALYLNRGENFREFTVMFHDEVKIVQAFPQWYKQLPFTLGSAKDGFAINYGTGGIGSEIIGNRLGVGPMYACPECKYEEFFFTGWAVGDPAMIVDTGELRPGAVPPGGGDCSWTGAKATKAFLPRRSLERLARLPQRSYEDPQPPRRHRAPHLPSARPAVELRQS